MKILVDIGHPAHVHVFKNAIRELRKKGHEITIVTKDKEVAIGLLEKFGLDYINLGKPGKGLFGKAHSLVYFDYQLYKIAKKVKPDILIGMGSPYLGHVSRLITETPHFLLGYGKCRASHISHLSFCRYNLYPVMFPEISWRSTGFI